MKKLSLVYVISILCSCLYWFFAAVPVAHAQSSQANVLFVLDASGSMWGRIENQPKISIAKKVLNLSGGSRDLLRSFQASLRLLSTVNIDP